MLSILAICAAYRYSVDMILCVCLVLEASAAPQPAFDSQSFCSRPRWPSSLFQASPFQPGPVRPSTTMVATKHSLWRKTWGFCLTMHLVAEESNHLVADLSQKNCRKDTTSAPSPPANLPDDFLMFTQCQPTTWTVMKRWDRFNLCITRRFLKPLGLPLSLIRQCWSSIWLYGRMGKLTRNAATSQTICIQPYLSDCATSGLVAPSRQRAMEGTKIVGALSKEV